MAVSELEKTQKDVFGQSYSEVLLFLKHQDDKINRVLTALAFLTAAGVTLYIFSRSDASAYADFPTFANAGVSLDDYFFASFIVGVAVAVALSVVALDPTAFEPKFLESGGKKPEKNGPGSESSLLFYGAIAGSRRDEWQELLKKGESELFGVYVRSLHADTHRLARRARHKVRRAGTASSVVQFTVVALALLGVTRLNHVTESGRWVLLTAVLAGFVITPLIDFAYFWIVGFPNVRTDEYQILPDVRLPTTSRKETYGRLGRGLLFFLPFIGVALAGLIIEYKDWEPVTFALFGTLLLRLVERLKVQGMKGWPQIVGMGAVAAAAGVWFWCH